MRVSKVTAAWGMAAAAILLASLRTPAQDRAPRRRRPRQRPGAVPRTLCRVPWRRREGRCQSRSHRALGGRRHRRARPADHSRRRAEHAHAVQLGARGRAARDRRLSPQPRTARAGPETARGNVDNGERLFWASCGSCHAVGPRGGALGPDLSRIGSQPRDALMRSIREPGAAFPAGYQTVTLVTRDGQRVRGTRKSEDAFSIQIMDTHEQLQGYLKSTLARRDPGAGLADAGVRARQAERQRSQRSPRVS